MLTGAIAGVISLWPHSVPANAKFSRANVGPTPIGWDAFKIRLLNARVPMFTTESAVPRGAYPSVVLLAQIGTTDTAPPETTDTDTTDTDTTDTDTTDTDTTDTETTDTETTDTETETTDTETTGTETTSTEPAPEPPVNPVPGQSGEEPPEPSDEPVPLNEKQRRKIKRLSGRVGRKAMLPPGCERSVTSRSCPAAAHMGAVPGPARSLQGTVDRYPYVNQKNVLRYLLRTLPLVRYRMSQGRRVPIGVDVTVHVTLTGDQGHRFYLQWSVLPRGSGGGPLLTWQKNRIADVITLKRSTHLAHFWVPIPKPRHGYVIHLRVLDSEGTPLDEQDGTPGFH